MHEVAHNLAFKGLVANRIFSIIANLPLGIPAAMYVREGGREGGRIGREEGRRTGRRKGTMEGENERELSQMPDVDDPHKVSRYYFS